MIRKIWKSILFDISLGKLFGIPILIHSSCFLVFLIYAITSLQFIGIYLCAFAIILLHEFGHCLAARQLNIAVDSMRLFILGSVATIKFPEKLKEDFLITISGSLVNVALSLILFFGSYYLVFFKELLILNLGLLLLNFLPMFPMDGGRIFRMILFHYSKNYFLSTIIAARIGQFLAGFIILYGILTSLSSLIFFGLFVMIAAENEYQIMKSQKLSCINQSLKIMQETQQDLRDFEARNFRK